MEFIMDMVHHNPGEAPFETNFLKPEKLREYGYNAQVFKHINTAVNFLKYDEHLFDESPEAMEWIKCLKEKIRKEIQKAKTEGLKVYYHIDLFVLPKAVYEKYKDEICDVHCQQHFHIQDPPDMLFRHSEHPEYTEICRARFEDQPYHEICDEKQCHCHDNGHRSRDHRCYV